LSPILVLTRQGLYYLNHTPDNSGFF
jgi:hypothetical protein